MDRNEQSANFQRGNLLLGQGRYPEAEKYYREALALDPENHEALVLLSRCQYLQTGKLREGLHTIDRAIGLEPNHAPSHSLRSLILTKLDRGHEALASAKQAVALDPFDPFGFVAESAAHQELKNWTGMETAARKAMELAPDDSSAANLLAAALRFQNKKAENQEQIRGMLERDPEDPQIHCSAGWTALEGGDVRKAQEHFREALRLDPESEQARVGLMETFKARSLPYRMYLNWCFTMQKLSNKMQWVVVLGFIFGVKMVRAALLPTHPVLAYTVMALYLLFCLWVHIARPFGNMFLLMDSFARHALKRLEAVEGVLVGGSVVVGFSVLIVALFTRSVHGGLTGALMMALAFPLAYTITNRSLPGRLIFGFFSLVIVIGIFLHIAEFLIPGKTLSMLSDLAFTGSIIGALVTTWLANVEVLNHRREE